MLFLRHGVFMPRIAVGWKRTHLIHPHLEPRITNPMRPLSSRKISSLQTLMAKLWPTGYDHLQGPRKMIRPVNRANRVVLTFTDRLRKLGTVSGSRHSRRSRKKSTAQANFFYFNSSSRLARKRRSDAWGARASAFSYEARASGILPNLRHRSARAECAR